MNKSSTEKRAQIIAALVEGNSIRATCRMTGAAKNTVVKLLADLGRVRLRHISQPVATQQVSPIQKCPSFARLFK